jgi:hypothetical protein
MTFENVVDRAQARNSKRKCLIQVGVLMGLTWFPFFFMGKKGRKSDIIGLNITNLEPGTEN